MNTEVMFSHNSDEWSTPQDFYDNLNKQFNFTLDPCATNYNTKCKKFFTIEDNGLKQSWAGESVFVNPPYSDVKTWVEKCYNEMDDAKVIVLLVPARTDTKWFHKYCYNQKNVKIYFVKGRLKFGDGKNSAPFPSMVVVFQKNILDTINN